MNLIDLINYPSPLIDIEANNLSVSEQPVYKESSRCVVR